MAGFDLVIRSTSLVFGWRRKGDLVSGIRYVDFDLLIERSGEGYTVRVWCAPVGQAATSFKLPFSDLELENFVLRL
jgi:hypothetical protein